MNLVRGVCLVLLLLNSAGCSAEDLMTRQMMDEAVEWSAKGRDDLAARIWLKLLSYEPGNGEALVKLGLIEFRAGNLKSAQSLHQRALRVTPTPIGLGRLTRALNPTEVILPNPKIQSNEVVSDSLKLDSSLKPRKDIKNISRIESSLTKNQKPKTISHKWEDRRLFLEKSTRDNPGDTRYLILLASHLAEREATRREAIRQLEALNLIEIQSSEIKLIWQKALLALKANQGDQSLFKNYLSIYPGSTPVLRRLKSLEEQVARESNRGNKKIK